jgi:ribonuclease HI
MNTMANHHLALYTDGACTGNPGPGGWAYILKNSDGATIVECAGGEPQTTNNRMELMSVIEGLRSLEPGTTVDLYSDSQYVVKGLNEWMDGWKAKGWTRGRREPVKNLDLWKQLDELRAILRLNSHWIRGHSEHPENERCDELAVAAAAHAKKTGAVVAGRSSCP